MDVLDLTARNNDSFSRQRDLSGWADDYVLEDGVFRLHIRRTADDPEVLIALSSEPTDRRIVYDPGSKMLAWRIPLGDMRRLPAGTYEYDCRWQGFDGAAAVSLFGGEMIVTAGVTR